MKSNTEDKYVIFKINNEYYGIDVGSVVAIEKMENITRIPNSPRHIKGLINLRGDVITLVDLKYVLESQNSSFSDSSRIIVVLKDEITLGLIVDSSSEVIDISPKDVDNSSSINIGEESDYIRGIGKIDNRLIILLDLLKIFKY